MTISIPHSVFNVNDEVKVMIIDLDAERGRISTKQLEPEPGDMIRDRQLVYDKAEEMAAKYREQMRAKQQVAFLPTLRRKCLKDN